MILKSTTALIIENPRRVIGRAFMYWEQQCIKTEETFMVTLSI